MPAGIVGANLLSVTPTGGATSSATPGSLGSLDDTVDLPAGSSIVYVISATVSNSAGSGQLSNTATVAALAGFIDPNSANNSATVSEYDGTTASLSNLLQSLLPPSGGGAGPTIPIAIVSTDPTTAAAQTEQVLAAVNNLSASTSGTIALTVPSGTTVNDVNLTLPPGVTLDINGQSQAGGSNLTIVGNSPAFVVSSGNVVVTNVTFTTATDYPTIEVTGGTLTLRNDTILQSGSPAPGSQRVADIEVTGGSLDLGTAASSGNNVLDVNAPDQLISSTVADAVSAVGNTFELGGQQVTDPNQVSLLMTTDITAASTISAIRGQSTGSHLLATFNGAYAGASSDACTINWGDGSTPTQSMLSLSGGVFSVSDSHTYAQAGVYQVTVTLQDVYGDEVSSDSSKTTVLVAGALLTDVTPSTTYKVIEGQPSGNEVLATFVDADPQAGATDFQTTVLWPSTVVGTPTVSVQLAFRGTSGSIWNVVGNATYAATGSYAITVCVSDVNGPTISNSAETQVVVVDNLGILLLDPSGKGALNVSGNGSVAVAGGALVVDSSSSNAAVLSGNATVSAADTDLTGGSSTSGNARFQGTVERG